MLDLKALQCFVVVAERLSVSRAAPLLHISQSALSRQIQALEASLGVRLFDRVGRRLLLTAVGDDLLPRAASLLDQASALSSRVQSMAQGEIGVLKVGATPQTIEGLLSRVLATMRVHYPSIEISLVEGSNDYLLEQVAAGGAHVAIAALPERHAFAHQELFMATLYAAMPPQWPRSRGRHLDIRSLARHPLLLLRKGFMTRAVFDRACVRANLHPHTVLESDSTQSILALADAGHGVAVVSSSALLGRRADDPRRFISLTLDKEPLGHMVSAVWNPKRARTSVLDPFLRALAADIAARPIRPPALGGSRQSMP